MKLTVRPAFIGYDSISPANCSSLLHIPRFCKKIPVMSNNFIEQPQPLYCLSDPVSQRLEYVSPSLRALGYGKEQAEYAWQLFDDDPAFAKTYNDVSLSSLSCAPIRLADCPLVGARLLFSSLIRDGGRELRMDVMIALGDDPKQMLGAAILVSKYAESGERAEQPALDDPDEVRVTMFGGFTVETSLGRLSAGDISSRQSCLLLIYLLCNRGRVAPVYELAEALWPDQLLDNPYNMVKNVAFRLRRHLTPICEKPLIVAYHGTYVINPELHFLVDSDIFDALIRQYYRGDATGDPETLAGAIHLYRGSLLPGFDTELWLIARTQYYKSAFRKAVLDYAALLQRQGNMLALYAVLRDAMAVCPREPSLHVAMIHALAQDKGPDAALRYLQNAGALLSQTEQRLISRQLEQLVKEGDGKA